MQGAGCRVQGSGFRVQGSGFRVQGSGLDLPRLLVGLSFADLTDFAEVRVGGRPGVGRGCLQGRVGYRGTSLTRNTHPPRITLGPLALGYCRVLRGGGVLMSEVAL